MESIFSNLAWSRPITTGLVGGLSILRQEQLNLVYYIKEYILPLNGYIGQFTETLQPATQTNDINNTLPVTPYQSSFNDWVYFNPDPSNPALTGVITTPILSTSGSLASIDYKNGIIYYSGIQNQPITVTYNYYTVYVQDGFPDFGVDLKAWDTVRVPLVTVDFTNRRNQPFTVGGGYQEDRMFIVNILGLSDSQRDDIADIVENNLRYNLSTTIDYSYGFPLNGNGSLNTSFDRGPASRWKVIRFQDTSSRAIRTPSDMPEKFRHQTNIVTTVRIN